MAQNINIPFLLYFSTLFYYIFTLLTGYIRDYFNILYYRAQTSQKGYPPLLDGFNVVYTRYVYGPMKDCWNRPICSTPGVSVNILQQEGDPFLSTLRTTGKVKDCLNLGSYNYLGFAQNKGKCLEDDLQALNKYSSTTCSSRFGMGTTELHLELEKTVAEFLGMEDAIVYGMGYGTNTTSIPALIGKGGLILSDTLNHASIAIGCRLSGAQIMTFKHNDVKDLEKVLREAVVKGQPKTGKPWSKILIIVEGLYSMEGDIVCLPEIVAIKKKYKAYLYVDEAHSIGALGKSGRGVCEYWGIDHREVDVLMGTFTKSFASCGGYVASSKKIIEALRCYSSNNFYDSSMSIVCVQQAMSVLNILLGRYGEKETLEGIIRIENLKKNSIYFRNRLKEFGFVVLGNEDSPVIPLIIFTPSYLAVFSRYCLLHNLAVVVVGYPATDLMTGRARFCLSSSHTIQELDRALSVLKNIGDICSLRLYKDKQNNLIKT